MDTNFKLSEVRSLIIYDLEPNDVSAKDIATKSKVLFARIKFSEEEIYNFPSTVLKANLPRDEAKKEFYRALNETGSKAKVSRLLICEIKDKNGYIMEVK